MRETERRLAAILFTDIVGYTALMGESEERALRARQRHRRLVQRLVERYGGNFVEEIGDEALSTFGSALDAVHCALSIQASLGEDAELRLRIGVHLGDVVFEGGRVYGDGVNVASRIRPLAEPGGVCVSGEVWQAVRNQRGLEASPLGERELKNVDRRVAVFALSGIPEEPKRAPTSSRLRAALGAAAIAVLLLGATLWASWPAPLGLVLDATGFGVPEYPPLPNKPSIVVLPFENMSDDAEQEYFSDGITEDLTTALSRNDGLFVISRSTASTYKGKPVKIGDVGRELGVRYVLEGSVRKAGGRVRITAQLIDAESGFHLWSERYDRELADIFAVQSELAAELQRALQVEIRDAEVARTRRARTNDLDAYDAFIRGLHHFERFRRADLEEARRWFRRAAEIDPAYAAAHAALGNTYHIEYVMLWNRDPSLLDRAEEHVRRALELDPEDTDGLVVMANVMNARERFEEGRAFAEKAMAIEPSWDVPYLIRSISLSGMGRFVAALQSIDTGARLNPAGPTMAALIGFANLRVGRGEEAERHLLRARAQNPDQVLVRLMLARLYEGEGRLEEAHELVREALRVNPDLTAEEAAAGVPGGGEGFVEPLRRAGLP